jgi:glycosyltransferase involved in cell wall biosynthesis
MIKILHIITRLDRGGSSEDVLSNFVHFTARGCRVLVAYGPTAAPSAPFVEQQAAHPDAFLLVPHLLRSLNPLRDCLAFIRLYALIRREKPDIVHTHTSKAGILGRWAAWLYRKRSGDAVRIIHSTHGHVFYGYYCAPVSRLFVLAERMTARITDRIVTLTENETAEHLDRSVGRREQFAVVHSGVDQQFIFAGNDIRAALGAGPGGLIIGSVGRLDPVKGYRYLIDALAAVERMRPDLAFACILVGDGSERAALERRARRLRNRVVFAGWQENVLDFIANIDIYVQPSLNEGLGKTVVLAQMLRRPVIASRVQGLAALIADGSTGLLVPPADARRLAEAVCRLVDDPAARAALGAAAQQQSFRRDPATGMFLSGAEYMNRLTENIYAL